MTKTQQPDRRIDYLPLTDLTPNPRNPKAHDHTTIDASVGRFGYVEPIVRDERTGLIVSGHGRAEALTAMEARGDTPPDGVHTDPNTGTWLVPVVVGWASHSDTEANAALIALNRTTELGGWVDDSLLELLEELGETEGGFIGVGYGQAELEALRAMLAWTADEPDPMTDAEFDDFTDRGPDTYTLHIEGLTLAEVERFEDLPGEDNAERLRGLLDD